MNNAELFKNVFGIYAEEFWAYPKDKMLDWLDYDATTADVVEVVRCKECKHSTELLVKPYCNLLDMNVDYRYFCADGERRTDDDRA